MMQQTQVRKPMNADRTFVKVEVERAMRAIEPFLTNEADASPVKFLVEGNTSVAKALPHLYAALVRVHEVADVVFPAVYGEDRTIVVPGLYFERIKLAHEKLEAAANELADVYEQRLDGKVRWREDRANSPDHWPRYFEKAGQHLRHAVWLLHAAVEC